MKMLNTITRSHAPASVLLIRVLVGTVFLSEGIQKFLFAGERGVGRFVKIGLPAPEILAPAVGSFEIACGMLLLVGLFTRLAAIPLVIIMLTALATTKIPILIDSGFWQMAHAARTDWSMLLGSVFLLIVGSGPWSLDTHRNREKPASSSEPDQVLF